MTFDEIFTQVVATLQRQGRVSYGALKRRFTLDDTYLQDLKDELIEAQQLAVDEDGRILVWRGRTGKAEAEKRGDGENQFGVRSSESSQPAAPPTLDSELETPNSELISGERRPLTVMFCGLLETDQGQASSDLEEIGSLVRQYQATCAAVIKRYDGYIAQYLSDGLLVYFGYPVAHEDDARRAVWAGLEMTAAIRGPGPGLEDQDKQHVTSLQVRVGIHTGMAIFNTIGGADQREHVALGETPKVAAHIQEMADPNTIALSAATYRLVRDHFACQLLEGREIHGFPAVSEMYRVTAAHSSSPRAETITRGTTLPLIGREEELHLFLKRWEQVQEGYGQVVLLSGEAGIGKSRLLSEVWNRLATPEVSRFVLRCSPYHQQSAFYPLLDLSQRTLQFTPGDSPQEKHRKLARALGAFHLEETLPLLATFLGLPTPQAPLVHLSPQKQREAVMQVVVSSWMTVAERQPLLIVWEDVQWADPSTLDLLQLFIDQIPTTRILVVITFRPDFVPPWTSRSYVTSLMLDRLGRDQVQAIIQAVAEQKVLPAKVVREIIAKTDGVPLFVEELTKMVLESGLLLAQEGHYILKGPLPPLAIPTTLHDSLLARLDRLGEAREIAQLGSIFGREFSSSLLKAMTPIDEDNLQQALAKLVKVEVLYRRGVEPQVQYVFKHALIQEAAYQSLLKSRRQQYHQRVAQMFAERSPETQHTQPELLAHHYTEAGLPSYALRYWQRAGQNAIERSAFAEAVGYLTKGRTVLNLLPNTPERVPQEIELSIALGSALMAPKGYAAPEVEQTYAHALALCRRIGETPRLLQALSGLTVFYLTRGEIQTARELGAQCLGLAQQEKNPIRLLQSLVVLGNVLFYAGEFGPSLERFREGLALYNSTPQDSQRALQDPGVNSLTYVALALWCLGYPDQAVQQSEAALALARKLNRPLNHVLARVLAAGLYQFRDEAQLAFMHAETAVALASEQEFAQWAAYGMIFRGWALAAQGEAEEGRHFILQGIAKTRDMGAEVAHPWILAMLADVCLRTHRIEEGLTAVGEALEVVQRRGEGMYEAELYRLKGELTLQQQPQTGPGQVLDRSQTSQNKSEVADPRSPIPDPQVEAEADFLKAIAVATCQQAKMWELRATTSLARLWQSQGKYHTARNTLSGIYHWFTEGAETTDLQEAKALLATLTEAAGVGARE